jgi:hypothetical protein
MARLSYAPRVPRSRHTPIRLRFVPTKTEREQSMIDRDSMGPRGDIGAKAGDAWPVTAPRPSATLW